MPTKISQLTSAPVALTGAEQIELVQSGVSYKRTLADVWNWVYTAIVNTTSGTALTVTSGIPSTAQKIEILFNGVSTNTAAQPPIIRLGDAGGIETTGYAGLVRSGGNTTSVTNGFYIMRAADYVAADLVYGVMRLYRWDPSLFLWFGNGLADSSSTLLLSRYSGRKATSEVTTTIQVTTPGGTAAFDAGSIRVRYR
jgi:hypothetical protein